MAHAPAIADPLPAQYSGSTSGDVLSLGLSALGIADIDAAIAHSATEVDSTGDPRAHAESSNVGANALGLGIDPISGEANSGPGTPTDSYTMGLGDISVPGVLTVGALQGSGSTNWPGDISCVPDGTPIAQSTTELANANLGLNVSGFGLNILELGAVSTSGNTTLDSGSVVSTASGNLAGLSLLNNAVEIQVLNSPELTATSDGTTGTVTANDYSVEVTIAGQQPVVLSAGMSIPINLDLGAAQANLTLSVGQLQDNSVGATASGSMDFLNVSGTITAPLLGEIADLDLGLLPLSATATAPDGGVECDRLDAPTITSPLAPRSPTTRRRSPARESPVRR
ncbi:hypothetical protein [Saccharopolyspora flava]|uniref:Uncharacterized protein n=1 Tax=Saccharopolyspora flava TaxID=95161 RepID=A0A1I6QF25_9PSEU|nr:hypothetical protein [Saccharopolyspora flava]SFS51089.1 hypothetical protein SAMN05660874_01401 [Saccharopolyspora flava]